MKIRNAQFTQVGTINCEIEHPTLGWHLFHATPNDPAKHGREIYAAALASGPAAYVEPPIDLDALADQARSQRNALLAASDWTQMSDAPVNKVAWATYRQALRDITAQAGFPESIDWPVQPV